MGRNYYGIRWCDQGDRQRRGRPDQGANSTRRVGDESPLLGQGTLIPDTPTGFLISSHRCHFFWVYWFNEFHFLFTAGFGGWLINVCRSRPAASHRRQWSPGKIWRRVKSGASWWWSNWMLMTLNFCNCGRRSSAQSGYLDTVCTRGCIKRRPRRETRFPRIKAPSWPCVSCTRTVLDIASLVVCVCVCVCESASRIALALNDAKC